MAEKLPAPKVKETKKRKMMKDPNAPKRPASAYILFCNEARPKIIKKQPGLSAADVMKDLGAKWAKTSEKTKKPYIDASNEASDKYKADKKAYEESEDGKAFITAAAIEKKKLKAAEKRRLYEQHEAGDGYGDGDGDDATDGATNVDGDGDGDGDGDAKEEKEKKKKKKKKKKKRKLKDPDTRVGMESSTEPEAELSKEEKAKVKVKAKKKVQKERAAAKKKAANVDATTARGPGKEERDGASAAAAALAIDGDGDGDGDSDSDGGPLLPPNFEKAYRFLRLGKDIDLNVFLPWWDQHKGALWVQKAVEKESNRGLLEVAMLYSCPAVVLWAVFEAHPDGVVGTNDYGCTTLHTAIDCEEVVPEDLLLVGF